LQEGFDSKELWKSVQKSKAPHAKPAYGPPADLQNKGVRCRFAPHDIQGGRKLHEQIDQAIRLHERVLLILSPHSMNSEWVKTEIANARKREIQQNKKVFFPLRLVSFETIRDWECFDADTGKDLAREIREFFIPDFSNWKHHDAYLKAFGRLMKDLRAGKKGEGKMAT
jgi:TIR domain-containing protein